MDRAARIYVAGHTGLAGSAILRALQREGHGNLLLRRHAELELGDAAKARRKLKWKPRVSFRDLVAEMMREDLKGAERDALVSRHGYQAYGGRE